MSEGLRDRRSAVSGCCIALRLPIRKGEAGTCRAFIGEAGLCFRSISGFSLGLRRRAGMIEPNMATMLVYLLTDLDVPRDVLRQMCAGYPRPIWPFPPAVATRCLSA